MCSAIDQMRSACDKFTKSAKFDKMRNVWSKCTHFVNCAAHLVKCIGQMRCIIDQLMRILIKCAFYSHTVSVSAKRYCIASHGLSTTAKHLVLQQQCYADT